MSAGEAVIVRAMALVLVGIQLLSSYLKEIAQEVKASRLILQRLLDRDVDREHRD
jgi:hypothetical protein